MNRRELAMGDRTDGFHVAYARGDAKSAGAMKPIAELTIAVAFVMGAFGAATAQDDRFVYNARNAAMAVAKARDDQAMVLCVDEETQRLLGRPNGLSSKIHKRSEIMRIVVSSCLDFITHERTDAKETRTGQAVDAKLCSLIRANDLEQNKQYLNLWCVPVAPAP